ncbi:thioredoxin family protein [Candidatus Galacturonibacter soehngenii]|uniref:Thioredoxin n=1 Tax=Candidatus Galacturonatibacter soehngenii TaxID=2307010 RepID=A0A7V7QN44_9FIRM|nr:thioredoxin domain-containing protein [Candidatus Galacturonibacter soehngenii]KAB1439980.1 thioredoxin fold domain-containing protein [Candidatus Galacturonibacter soehngenii]
MALRITQANFEANVLKETKPVIVEFYSDSCIPCKQMASILGDLEEDYEDKIAVCKVNVTYDEMLVNEYQVMSSPTTLLFYDGLEKARVTGIVKKDQLIELVTAYFK